MVMPDKTTAFAVYLIRHSFSSSMILQPTQIDLLLEQKRVIEGIAKAGKNRIIVGRNAGVLLSD